MTQCFQVPSQAFVVSLDFVFEVVLARFQIVALAAEFDAFSAVSLFPSLLTAVQLSGSLFAESQFAFVAQVSVV